MSVSGGDGDAVTPDLKTTSVHIKKSQKLERWAAHGHCPNALPNPETWPTRPILLRRGPRDKGSGSAPLGINKVIKIDTKLFSGRAMLRLRGPESKAYFQGKRRVSSLVVQGKFKKELGFREVYTGQEFTHALQPPGHFLAKAVLAFFRFLSPSMEAEYHYDNPKADMVPNRTHFMSPVAATAGVVQVTSEADAPKLTPSLRLNEDMTKIGGDLKDYVTKHPDMEKRIIWRKKYFHRVANLEKYAFDTDNVYTFDFYGDKIFFEEFHLKVLGRKFSVENYLNGQPLRLMTKLRASPDVLWDFEVWHERQTEPWNEATNKVERIQL